LEDAGNASVFAFEIVISDEDSRRVLTGDGLALDSGRVRINRAAYLKHQVAAAGLDAEGVISHLHQAVSNRLSFDASASAA
jgi:hypothetical protein